jgi:hypothetical protein
MLNVSNLTSGPNLRDARTAAVMWLKLKIHRVILIWIIKENGSTDRQDANAT